QSTSQVVGYDSAMVEFLVSRLARAVLDAQRDLRLARVAWSATAVWGHTRNRSYQAFLRNKPEWTPPAPVTPGLDPTHRAVNPLWTLLRVDQRGRGAVALRRTAAPPGGGAGRAAHPARAVGMARSSPCVDGGVPCRRTPLRQRRRRLARRARSGPVRLARPNAARRPAHRCGVPYPPLERRPAPLPVPRDRLG